MESRLLPKFEEQYSSRFIYAILLEVKYPPIVGKGKRVEDLPDFRGRLEKAEAAPSTTSII
ncbi:MAG: hypothetical protein QW291_01395 [Thermofilaceae archaeon]